jgi:hypothetical protein
VPHAIRPGDVLAGRYQLVDLLDESAGGLFYRAHDTSLDRSVAVHIIRADDRRADLLREAARTSARVVDRRLLRVLDVDETSDQTDRDGSALCYVVNEWATGISLDILLAAEGPLAPRRAAWIVAEVAASIEVAHAAGVAHGRLVPENVLIDRTGSVRVIGFAVDAALHGLPAARVSDDVTDLAALLYAALTGRWPGVLPSLVKPAPHAHGRVLRPRQVRAGVPRVLDTLCDAVLNPDAAAPGSHARGAFDLTTAGGIGDTLREFVGDSSGMTDAEAAAVRRREAGRLPMSTPAMTATSTGTSILPVPDRQAEAPEPPAAVLAAMPSDAMPSAEEPSPGATDEPTDEPVEEPAAREASHPTERPTEAGIPIFGDDGEVAWLAKRAETPPPPPPFEEIPERPLFAPDPVDGSPARRPRVPAGHPGGHPGGPGAGGYWPWDTSTGTGASLRMSGSGIIEPVEEDDEVEESPGRSWLWLAALVGALALVLLAVVVAFNVGRGRTPLGAEPDPEPSRTATTRKATQTPPPGLTAYEGVTAQDFDPQGDPPEEYPELARLAVDGNPDTAWRTMIYSQQLGPGGLKTGVGLVLDLGASGEVDEVSLDLVGSPTGVAAYVTETAPRGVRDLSPVATATADGTALDLTLDEPATGRYVTVWLTSLPEVEDGFRGEIAEATVLGTPAP